MSTDGEELKGTRKFVFELGELKNGDLGIFRAHAGQRLDASLQGFDLFTSFWWGLKEKKGYDKERIPGSIKAWMPNRETSWIIAKLYAQYRFNQTQSFTLARYLGSIPRKDFPRFQRRFDLLLQTPFDDLEPTLQWALRTIQQRYRTREQREIPFDWVQLTNDLSRWNNDDTKKKWATDFLQIS